MTEITIRAADKDDAQTIADMLTSLAGEIGDADRFCSTSETISRYGFGTNALFHSMIAERRIDNDSEPMGLALFFPTFSTTRARPGLYIQDLWVSDRARGSGIGRQLITSAIDHAAREWGAAYLSLTVYADNPSATIFYRRLGFKGGENDCPMLLDGAAFSALRSTL